LVISRISDLAEAAGLEALLDHLADTLDRSFPHWTRDHPGLAEPTAAGAAAKNLYAHPLVDTLRDRHQRLLRVGPLVEVHRGAFGHPLGGSLIVRSHLCDLAIGQITDVIAAWYVHTVDFGEPAQQFLPPSRTSLLFPVSDHCSDFEDDLFAIPQDGGVDEVSDRLWVERGMAARNDDWMVVGALGGVQRDPGEVQCSEQVGVAELGSEGHPNQIEVADRPVGVDSELRDPVLAHQPLEIRPHRVGAFSQHIRLLVEHLVKDHDALVRYPDLVGVRIHQRPAHRGGVPVLHRCVELAADILHRLGDLRQQNLKLLEHRRAWHTVQRSWAPFKYHQPGLVYPRCGLVAGDRTDHPGADQRAARARVASARSVWVGKFRAGSASTGRIATLSTRHRGQPR
jgi:hypothetical protein